jgi:putative flippase GtrA
MSWLVNWFKISRLLRFGSVGVFSTGVYGVLAMAFDVFSQLTSTAASLLAYTVAAAVSYLGQKHLTFVSSGSHVREISRFAALTALGYGLAFLIPFLLTDQAGFNPLVAIFGVCVAIPAINFLVMQNYVFRP